MQVLGIVGALDPHTHKVNQADIQGEGKLEREGVRPQRQADPTGGLGGGAANTLGTLHCAPAEQIAEVKAAILQWEGPSASYSPYASFHYLLLTRHDCMI